jgi:hypothetical protein
LEDSLSVETPRPDHARRAGISIPGNSPCPRGQHRSVNSPGRHQPMNIPEPRPITQADRADLQQSKYNANSCGCGRWRIASTSAVRL